MTSTTVSIIIRALNEERWLGEALAACARQQRPNGIAAAPEVILVDSGSVDRTMEIAAEFGARIVHIQKSEFTFGRSLNFGCEAATGDILVFMSAHCIPADEQWLERLIAPVMSGTVDYVYGRQLGNEVTRFSEHQVFAQYFPDHDKLPQEDFFVNNANAAIRKETWRRYRFDEAVTGLEDMVLAKSLAADGGKIGYVTDAPVVHIHEETFRQTRRRYYREALVLREIMPEIHFNFGDFLRYTLAGVFHDFSEALEQRAFFKVAPEIVAFRTMQYFGAWRGHNEHRVLSRAQKETYYYPRAKSRRRGGDRSEMVARARRDSADKAC